MRWKLVALILGPCLCNTGCSMYAAIAKNSVEVPTIVTDECLIEQRSKVQACAAWREVVAKSGDEHFSAAYQDGFTEGYADYLIHGGKGEPPPVPPYRYLLIHDQNPQGREKQEQWFAGWRHGAALAIRSGQREYITVPLSTVWPPNPYNVVYNSVYPARTRRPAAAPAESLPMPREERPEELPVPRVLPEQPQAGGPDLSPQPTTAAPGNADAALIPASFAPQTPASPSDGLPGQPTRGLLNRWLRPASSGDVGSESGSVLPRQP